MDHFDKASKAKKTLVFFLPANLEFYYISRAIFGEISLFHLVKYEPKTSRDVFITLEPQNL